MKVKSESEVAQLCPTLCDPMDCSPPGSSVHRIFQAGVLEWGAIAATRKDNQLTNHIYIIFMKIYYKINRVMASGPITSWQIDGETVETVADFIFLGSKITADGDGSP